MLSKKLAFPNDSDKHGNEAIITAARYLDYLRSRKRGPDFPIPEGVLLCYQGTLLRYVKANHETTEVKGDFSYLTLVTDKGTTIGLAAGFGIGAPVAVTILEGLVALGVKRFVSVGTAGTLRKDLDIGDLVICDRAIRDEGTSHHYVASSKYAEASPAMIGRIRKAADALGVSYEVGTTWTTDAPYRETLEEVRRYQAEGVATVEMEAAALFAVARARGVEMGAVFTVSDSLADLLWQPDFHSRQVKRGLEEIYEIARLALTGSP